jgi:hypothetical protein
MDNSIKIEIYTIDCMIMLIGLLQLYTTKCTVWVWKNSKTFSAYKKLFCNVLQKKIIWTNQSDKSWDIVD